ncbi:hypothetical protein LTR97_001672 [Elasticomyces elasticus]|uniref:Uncharacterized protein n=1 Tax=Elasticomyces elasticus TaxID=574655 RepID=A0AAN7WCP0_9PEZI|nr:hypothetical protein LTR97_001672 [Elasticomyces elasticus]
MSNTSTVHQESASTDMSTLIRQPMVPLAFVAGVFRPQMTACTVATYAGFHAIRWVSAYTIFGHFVLQNHEAYSKTSGQGIYEQMLSAHPVALPMTTLLTRSDATPQTFWAGISFLTVRALGMKKTVGLQATMMGVSMGLATATLWRLADEGGISEIAKLCRQDAATPARVESAEK